MKRLLPPALALFALSGCLSISGDKAVLEVYAPQVRLAADAGGLRSTLTLAIDEPEASLALDSNRIAVRPTPAQLQVYAGAIWSDHAPALVQSALIGALHESGRFRAVTRPTDPVAADLLLRLELRHFEAVYADGAKLPTVVIELQATLIDQRAHRVLATRRFRTEEASPGKQLPTVVEAFEAALAGTAQALGPWVLENAATP